MDNTLKKIGLDIAIDIRFNWKNPAGSPEIEKERESIEYDIKKIIEDAQQELNSL